MNKLCCVVVTCIVLWTKSQVSAITYCLTENILIVDYGRGNAWARMGIIPTQPQDGRVLGPSNDVCIFCITYARNNTYYAKYIISSQCVLEA